MTKIARTDLQQVEYAVYHWNFGYNSKLPGLNESGFPDPSFFMASYSAENFREIFSNIINNLRNLETLMRKDALLLCSGGVDSSLLALMRNYGCKDFLQSMLHISYIDHPDNDLTKFTSILNNFKSFSTIISLTGDEYIKGIESLHNNSFYQNTYAPTLSFALSRVIASLSSRSLITGSGPDELFYGMEKYTWDVFENYSALPVNAALEKLDPTYNEDTYLKLFNQKGLELFSEVKNNRKKLYQIISEIRPNIFEAQRLLAFSTVTAQHMELFSKVSAIYGLDHHAPLLNSEIVELALNTPIFDLVDLESGKSVEIGKKHLKLFLAEYMPKSHVYDRKIGFHAPATHYIKKYGKATLLNNLCYLPSWLDVDKTKKELENRFNNHHERDYFLYSLFNIILSKKQRVDQ